MKWKNILLPVGLPVAALVILLGISNLLAPVEAANKAEHRQQIMELLLPGNRIFVEEMYEGEDGNISRVYQGENGCVVETVTAGYVDDIHLLVGVNEAGKVTGIYVEDMNETWGLGQRAMTDKNFLSQFLGTSGEAAIGEDIDGVTGATVTSKAITKGINSAAAYVTGEDVISSATEWEE